MSLLLLLRPKGASTPPTGTPVAYRLEFAPALGGVSATSPSAAKFDDPKPALA